ncbi:MAG TPA: histidine kinase [Cyanobacteria bacterium UBA11372]|nr:histidine kinase [Cyanobacteria bacterium UBA11372]HBE36915.1 histidine kinase [Cyanobacteria bacterium UBA11368]HBE51759.1 histidine kinase [Cyanobacteria bacterium UBA11369]
MLNKHFNFNNFKLAKKLTLLLSFVFIVGIILSGLALASILNYKAQNEISTKALLLSETINSIRKYTSTEVAPELTTRSTPDEFLAQTIPSYSVRKIFENLQKSDDLYRGFYYKSAMLNPSNLQDKADAFETAIVEQFRQNQTLKELQGFRGVGNQDFFYIARPLSLTESSCLRCHGTPEFAPKKMIEIYGTTNGFNWPLNEVIGTQIVSVPASQILQNARQSFVLVMGVVAIVFAVTILITNLWLKLFIVRPIKKIAQVAEAVSTGDMEAEFEKVSNDEVGNLAEAFTRMKLSLAMAIKRFDRYRIQSRDRIDFGDERTIN